MRDLTRRTGVPAATIHFYAASGLLPRATKLSRTSARYPQATVERVRWIRTVQKEFRLSLRAISWVLAELGQVPIAEIRSRLALGELLDRRIHMVLPPEHRNLPPQLVAEMQELGLVAAVQPGGSRAPADDRLLEIIAMMRDAGFNPENGFTNEQLLLYRDAMRDLVRKEAGRIVEAGRRLGPEAAVAVVERGLPAIEELVRFFHMRAIAEAIEEWRATTAREPVN